MPESIDPDITDPYLLYLSHKNKYERWMRRFARTGTDYSYDIHILDIESSGHHRRWVAHVGDPNYDLASQLKERNLVDATRLIIFYQKYGIYVARQIGAMYDIDPGFFRAVDMNCHPSAYYNGIKHRVPEFLTGSQPQHLDLGYGLASVIVPHCKDNCNIGMLFVY